MSKHLITQIYGYLVCLVAIITFLICITALVNAIIDHGDPLHAGYRSDQAPSLASFENYKMDILKTTQKEGEQLKASYIPDDNTLRTMYKAAIDDKTLKSLHDSNRSILVNGMTLVISILFFITHWIWMRRIGRKEE